MRILYIAPHLSTGGMPQFLNQRLNVLNSDNSLFVLEVSFISNEYTVQRDKIKSLLGNNFTTLNNIFNKEQFLIDFINSNKFDIIHIESNVEDTGLSEESIQFIYSKDRDYRIIETIHNSNIGHINKQFIPDGYALCSQWQLDNKFESAKKHCSIMVCEYPILPLGTAKVEKKNLNNKVNILQVGLWTPGKNQSNTIEIANAIEKLFPGKYQFNFVGNLAPNFVNYWANIDIPDNVSVWGERDDVDQFYKEADIIIFNSLVELNPIAIVEAISYGKKTIIRNLPQYGNTYDNQVVYLQNDNYTNALKINALYEGVKLDYTPLDGSSEFKDKMLSLYGEVMTKDVVSSTTFDITYIDGVKCAIIGSDDYTYNVKFCDNITGQVVFQSNIKCGHWCAPLRKWYTNWRIIITSDNPDIPFYEETMEISNKKVAVIMESSALGDTLSWVGQLDKFQSTHNLTLDVFTYKNDMFLDSYPNINFIGDIDESLYYATYKVGVYTSNELGWDTNKNKNQWNIIALGQVCSDSLGLKYVENKPIIHVKYKDRPIDNKYVCIATHSTAQAKLWNNPTGWQEVVDHLIGIGYQVFNLSKEDTISLNGVSVLHSYDMDTTVQYLNNADFFIGLSSGLSWLAWSLNIHCFLISGFSQPKLEFLDNCTRIYNKNVCNGCWETNFFDKNDWNWCPLQTINEKKFECSKTISGNFVISNINKYLNK